MRRRELEHGQLVDELASQIHERILSGDFPAGTWLRQETLAALFDVSRTPVREALRKLQAEGILRLEPNRGALVRWPTAVEVRDSYVIRAELEGLATKLAVDNADEQLAMRLADAVSLFPRDISGMTDEHRRASWRHANDAFHDAIIEASGNGRLARSVDDVHKAFPRNLTWAALREDPALFERSAREHDLIRLAILSGDAEPARNAMIDHVLSAGNLVSAWFEHQLSTRTTNPQPEPTTRVRIPARAG
jgi:DNA-binding GntR family transcriptional regulator